MCPEDLISKIQPLLSQTLVREFGCIYKFVVVDDNGAAIYHLDLKHGTILLQCTSTSLLLLLLLLILLHCYNTTSTTTTTAAATNRTFDIGNSVFFLSSKPNPQNSA